MPLPRRNGVATGPHNNVVGTCCPAHGGKPSALAAHTHLPSAALLISRALLLSVPVFGNNTVDLSGLKRGETVRSWLRPLHAHCFHRFTKGVRLRAPAL